MVVERVVVNDRQMEEIVWTPPARPFFAEIGRKDSGRAPKGIRTPDLNLERVVS